MDDVLIPMEIKLSDIMLNKCNISPANYKNVDVKAPNKIILSNLLDEENPFIRGVEPGSSTYLKDLSSNVKFVRNSCIDKLNNIVQLHRTIFLNETVITYNNNQLLEDGDILVATDANIGDSALFHKNDDFKFILSSGMVKLNIKKNINKYYLLAMIKDSYFNSQLDSITPKGSTIRHSGSRILECLIPFPSEQTSWVIQIIENLMKNVIFSEKRAQIIQKEITHIFNTELNSVQIEASSTKFSDLLSFKRIDAGFYSKEVQTLLERIYKYPSGNKNLAELGYKIRRGPNLAKRDLGRSIKTEIFHPKYSLLIYPSDISDYGFIDKTTFLGASGKVWFLEKNDILFSAEGNVGKTFAICDNSMKFTTNFHGIIITPINTGTTSIENTIFISTFLSYLKQMGVMDKLSVGGQGGSFAVQYWDVLKFPNIDEDTLQMLKNLYFSEYQIHPLKFDVGEFDKLGIYEINKLRTLCSSLLKMLISDIKGNTLHDKNYYFNQLGQLD